MSGIPAYMGHIHVHVFHVEKQVLWETQSHHMVVDVAMNRTERLEGFKSLRGLDVPDVAGVPYLIHVLEEVIDLRDDYAMRIRYDTYLFQTQKTLNSKLLITNWIKSSP